MYNIIWSTIKRCPTTNKLIIGLGVSTIVLTMSLQSTLNELEHVKLTLEQTIEADKHIHTRNNVIQTQLKHNSEVLYSDIYKRMSTAGWSVNSTEHASFVCSSLLYKQINTSNEEK